MEPADLEKADPSDNNVQQHGNGSSVHHSSSVSSSSSSSCSSSSPQDAVDYMSRVQTAYSQRGAGGLERHPTALSRIATQRSQHTATVGAGLKPRISLKALPEFGAGKAYPLPLPAREEYVVEFVGPADPLHPQNWPIWKKWAAPVRKKEIYIC